MVVGGAPIGGVVGGDVSEAFGVRIAMALGALATSAAAVSLAPRLVADEVLPVDQSV